MLLICIIEDVQESAGKALVTIVDLSSGNYEVNWKLRPERPSREKQQALFLLGHSILAKVKKC